MKKLAERKIIISKAPPLGTKEHTEWANKMARIQIAMFVDDGATCEYCGYKYKNVDDFIRCNPRGGLRKKMTFVCSSCWKNYKEEFEKND